MKKILVLNGPNINMLGVREKNIYGRRDFKSLCAYIESAAAKLGVHVDLVQSNYEGDIESILEQDAAVSHLIEEITGAIIFERHIDVGAAAGYPTAISASQVIRHLHL